MRTRELTQMQTYSEKRPKAVCAFGRLPYSQDEKCSHATKPSPNRRQGNAAMSNKKPDNSTKQATGRL